MAKTLKLLDNGIRVKFIVKVKKYVLYRGSAQCLVNGGYMSFETIDEVISVGERIN